MRLVAAHGQGIVNNNTQETVCGSGHGGHVGDAPVLPGFFDGGVAGGPGPEPGS